MKNLIYLAAISILAMSCSDGGDDNSTPPSAENTAPAIPVLRAPEDLKLCLDNTVSLQWEPSVDPQKDNVIYQIQIALDKGFLNIVHTKEVAETDQVILLQKNSHYYWRIRATDSKELSSAYSSIKSFYTAGDPKTNHLPFAPELLQPMMVSPIKGTDTVTLQWNATDPDPQDTLVYDVFFGTTDPPTEKIATNNTIPKIPDVSIKPNKEYFWQLIVKDNNGGQTKGQIWNFKTK